MRLTFLGAATTVTGSRFLLETARARILVDCGMFQGSPNETIRNRIPLHFDPRELDAILITHAHLDHCGMLPVVVREGFTGPIYLTSASAELVEIVLLDSGRLQEEFAKRHDRWERRHPTEAVSEDEKASAKYQAALAEVRRADDEGHVATTIEAPAPGPGTAATSDASTTPAAPDPDIDAEEDLRSQPPQVVADLDDPLYTEADAEE